MRIEPTMKFVDLVTRKSVIFQENWEGTIMELIGLHYEKPQSSRHISLSNLAVTGNSCMTCRVMPHISDDLQKLSDMEWVWNFKATLQTHTYGFPLVINFTICFTESTNPGFLAKQKKNDVICHRIIARLAVCMHVLYSPLWHVSKCLYHFRSSWDMTPDPICHPCASSTYTHKNLSSGLLQSDPPFSYLPVGYPHTYLIIQTDRPKIKGRLVNNSLHAWSTDQTSVCTVPAIDTALVQERAWRARKLKSWQKSKSVHT